MWLGGELSRRSIGGLLTFVEAETVNGTAPLHVRMARRLDMKVFNPEVEAFLLRLRSMQWYACGGKPLARPQQRVIPIVQVGSWEAALVHTLSQETDAFHYDSRNELYDSRRPGLKSPREKKAFLREFKQFLDESQGLLDEVRRIAFEAIPVPADPEVGDCLDWVIRLCCVARQYNGDAEVVHLYLTIGDLFLQGHYVCGWQGDYPGGSLVVY